MSTSCKLDPNIRRARVRRAEAVAGIRMAADRNIGPKHLRLGGYALAADLDAVRKDPRLTGAQKDARFRALINR